MGRRERLQRLPSFRVQPPSVSDHHQRPRDDPTTHTHGGWRRDVEDEERTEREERAEARERAEWCQWDIGDRDDEPPPSGEALATSEYAPCGPVEELVRDWAFWRQPTEPGWRASLAQGARADGAWRVRLTERAAQSDPVVAGFTARHGLDPMAPVSTLAGLALRALRRPRGLAVAPVAGWPAMEALLLTALAQAPGEGVSDEVGVLAFHEAVTHGPSSLVRAVARAAWHPGWHPLAPWLSRQDDPGEVMAQVQGSWLALAQMREAQRTPIARQLPPPTADDWYHASVLRLLRRGACSLRTPGYPAFSLVIPAPASGASLRTLRKLDERGRHLPGPTPIPVAPRPDGTFVLTCRPLDPVALALRTAFYHSLSSSLRGVLAPQHIHYGLRDERGQEVPGHVTVREVWSAAAGGDFAPSLSLESIHDPDGLLGPAVADLVAVLGGVARSRGLTGGLVLRSEHVLGPALTASVQRRIDEGERVSLAVADPVVWKYYTSENGQYSTWYTHEVMPGPAGFERPDAEVTAASASVRLSGVKPGRDRVRGESVAEAERLAATPTGTVRVTCRDRRGEAVGFTTG